MKIIVVGIGGTGLSLIKNLSVEKHDIIAVDEQSEKVQDAIEKFDINGVVGNGCLAPILQEAGAQTADLLIAVTKKDEQNILIALVGKSLGARHLIAQVRNSEYYENFESMGENLGINMFVNLEATLAEKIARILRAPAEVNLTPFGGGRLEIAEITIPEGDRICGKTLVDVRAGHKKDFLVVTVERGDEVVVPNGETRILAGDVVTVCAKHQDLRDIFGYFGIEKQRVQSVMILGGEGAAYYLATRLTEAGISVKIIDKDKERCEWLKTQIKKIAVVCDDYNDKEVLVREGIEETDALVAMSPSDESNIVASLYARAKDMAKIITIVSSDVYKDMLDELDLNLVFSPYELAGSSIATYVRSINVPVDSQITSMHRIAGGKAEALQFNVGKNDRFVGKPVAELGKKIKSGVLMCAIMRKRVPIIPRGDTVLEENDDIIIVSLKKKITKLEEVLR